MHGAGDAADLNGSRGFESHLLRLAEDRQWRDKVRENKYQYIF